MKILPVLSLIAAFIFAGSVALPDTTAGSPRSIALAVAGALVAIIAGAAHVGTQGTFVPAQ